MFTIEPAQAVIDLKLRVFTRAIKIKFCGRYWVLRIRVFDRPSPPHTSLFSCVHGISIFVYIRSGLKQGLLNHYTFVLET